MAGYNRVADIDRGWRERLARIQLGQWGVTVGVIGAAASRVHPPKQTLDSQTERFLITHASKGNADAASQLESMRASDATKRINHIFKPGPTMAELGEIFEFGLGNNPERSWLRGYIDENDIKIKQKILRVSEKVYQGEMSPQDGMNLLGLSVVGGIKRRIQAFIPPPLAASTLAKKGPEKTTPLIDSAQWIGSITHAVEQRPQAQAREGSV
jgi:hypothetical protein